MHGRAGSRPRPRSRSETSSARGRRSFLKASALAATGAGLAAAPGPAAEPAKASLSFPPDFLLGVASAALQIEGSPTADGRGESIWDRWAKTPGRVKVAPDVTADHYARYREDLELLREIGVRSYRFSIGWPRVMPDGRTVNERGLAHYRDLVARLARAGIVPLVTLNHWDLPQALQDVGGWASRDTAEAFAVYARAAFAALGPDVGSWITHNEPWVVAFMGYFRGTFAPGLEDFSTALRAVHHLLLGHGLAVRAFREMKPGGKIGITLDLQMAVPASGDARDVEAAERENVAHHAIFADPILTGSYPQELLAGFAAKGIVVPEAAKGDLETIAQPIDYLGLNYYYLNHMKDAPGEGWPLDLEYVDSDDKKWKRQRDDAPGLLALLKRLDQRYPGTDIVITENGWYGDDVVTPAGEVDDLPRRLYVYDHLAACRRALDEGVRLRGYHNWSFLDDWEWGDYGRMGLVYVDYETQRRVVKKSGYWFGEGCRTGRFAAPW
jgi:beta-glucosidase